MADALREVAATLYSLPAGNQGQTRSCRYVLVRQIAMPSRPTPRDEKLLVAPAAPVDVALASDDSHLAPSALASFKMGALRVRFQITFFWRATRCEEIALQSFR